MKMLNKRGIKLLVGIGTISCLGIILFNNYDKSEPIKANPTQEIIINKGESYEAVIPKDITTPVQEPLLKNDTLLPDYRQYTQGTSITSSITKGDLYGYAGSKANDSISDMYVTKDNNFVMLVSSSNYQGAGYSIDPITRSTIVMFDQDGNLVKEVSNINGSTFSDNTRLYQSNDKSQFIIYTSKTYIVLNSSLDLVSQTSYDPPASSQTDTGLLVYGRTNIDYDNTAYLLTYNHFSNAVRKKELKSPNLKGYEIASTTTNLTDPIEFQSLTDYVGSYEAVTGLVDAPVNSFEGFMQNGLSKMEDGSYIGLYTLSNENNTGIAANGGQAYFYIVHWNSDGKIISYFDTESDSVAMTLLELRDGKNFYFRNLRTNELMKYSLEDNSINVVLSLTSNTIVVDAIDNETISLIGQTPLTSYFTPYNQGDNSTRFIISSANTHNILQTEKTVELVGIKKYRNLTAKTFETKKVAKATIFNDSVFSVNSIKGFQDGYKIKYGFSYRSASRDGIIPPKDGWPTKYYDPAKGVYRSVAYGILTEKEDYPPVINKGNSVVIDKTDEIYQKTTVNANNWTPLENKLITGEIDGSINDSKAVKVYDNFDINFNAVSVSITEFTKKINRNPNQLSAPIDWKSLGLDISKVGGQQVTYFISDSQKQITSTSKNINVVDNKTKYDETTVKAALRAENFTIKLSDLKTLQTTGGLTQEVLTGKDTTSKYGNVLAWDLDTGDNYNTDVTVDAEQLAVINKADKFGQYPLTYTLTKNNKPIIRETFVYVMGENSQRVGKDGSTVFNTEPITLPWDLVSTMDKALLTQKVMSEGKVVAYDFDSGEDITSTAVTAVEADVLALQNVEPEDTSNPPTKANPSQLVHYTITRDNAEETAVTDVGTKVTVAYRFATVTLNQKDEDGNTLYDTSDKELGSDPIELTNQIVGKTIDFTKNKTITDAKTALTNGTGYEFVDYYDSENKNKVTTPTAVPIKWPEPAKDSESKAPDDPNVYTLRYKGSLRFLSVPETMSFDSKLIRAFDQESTASKGNKNLEVGDNRKTTGSGEVKGKWKVSVKLTEDFTQKSNGQVKDVLPSILYYGDTLITKTADTVIYTNSESKTKTSIPLNDTSQFKLKIPAGKAKSGSYQATVQWGLTNAP